MNSWVLVLLLYCLAPLVRCRPHHHEMYSSHEEDERIPKISLTIPSMIRHNITNFIHKHHRDPLHIETTSGQIRGFSRTTQGKEISVFLGIPFAKPPIGDLRFRRPVPIEPWEGILPADTMPNSCYQERYEYFPGFEGEEMWNANTNISEDCLYLNVWAPKKRKDSPLAPLLVWIYGGGYMSGTITLDVYEASILAAENDVVVAAMQYRVGAFGFLYMPGTDGTRDSEASVGGNMGLYDQVLALRWLKDNAKVFGADPDTLTLFGESAGGGAVSALLLSPVSKGLARRGILQSGTLNAPWSYMSAETAYEIGRKLADNVTCNASMLMDREGGVADVISCLRNTDAKLISVNQWNFYSGMLGFPAAPTVDGEFLTAHPLELIRSGAFEDIEIMIGSNRDEGTYFILYDYFTDFDKDSASFLQRERFVEIINNIFKDRSQIERDAILFQYTAWEHMADGYLNQKMIGDVVGDYFFVCPTNYFANTLAEHGVPVYYYYFTQRSTKSLWGDWMGVMHGDEIDYVFGRPLKLSRRYSKSERQLSRRIMQFYTNFARTGKPTIEQDAWPLYSRNTPQFYTWSADAIGRVGTGPRANSCAFWNQFMPRIMQAQAEKSTCPCNEEIVPNAASAVSSHAVHVVCYFDLLIVMLAAVVQEFFGV